MRIARVLFAIVAVVAGPVGLGMLIAPDDTDRYFSWPIGPPLVAATVGGFYIASAIVFGWTALRADWAQARPLCFGVLALTIPTLIATLSHEEVFDFGRWQAVAWVGLFVAAPIAFGTVLFLQRGQADLDEDEPLRLRGRLGLGALAVWYAFNALRAGFDPKGVDEGSRFDLPPMSVRFLGCWLAFLACLAAFVAIRSRWRESWFALLALVLWPVGAALGVLRTLGDFDSSGRGLLFGGAWLFSAAVATGPFLDRKASVRPSAPSP